MKTKALSKKKKAKPHVLSVAAINASVLKHDPVMTARIKEYIPVAQLLDLFDLPVDEVHQWLMNSGR